jgi:hypothetical protein
VRSVAMLLIGYSVAVLLAVVATNPLFGDPHYVSGVSDPLIDQTLSDMAHGKWQNEWANVFGLHGVLALMPLAIMAALLGRRLRRSITESLQSGNFEAITPP